MRRLLILTLAALFLVLAACAPKPYEPAGEPTGNAALDDAVLALLQERCSAKNSNDKNKNKPWCHLLHCKAVSCRRHRKVGEHFPNKHPSLR